MPTAGSSSRRRRSRSASSSSNSSSSDDKPASPCPQASILPPAPSRTRLRGPDHTTLKEDRRLSQYNLQLAFESIFRRYSTDQHAFKDNDHVWDLRTNKIVERHGEGGDGLRFEIGHFGLPGAMGQEDLSESDEEAVEVADDSDNGIEKLNAPASLRRRESTAGASQSVKKEDDASSSEDEMGNFSKASRGIGEISRAYQEQRRVKAELEEDLAAFLEAEAGKQAKEIARSTATPAPHSRHFTKAESAAPFSRLRSQAPISTVPIIRGRPLGSRNSVSPFVKEESVFDTDIKPRLPHSISLPNSIGRQSRDSVSLKGLNTVHLRAHEIPDESDDELSILSTPFRWPTAKKEESDDDDLSQLLTDIKTESPVNAEQKDIKPRLVPVVEIIRRKIPPTASSSRSAPTRESNAISPFKRIHTPPSSGSFSSDTDSGGSPSSRSESLVSPTKRFRRTPRSPKPLSKSSGELGYDSDDEEISFVRRVRKPSVFSPARVATDEAPKETSKQSYRPASPPRSTESSDSYYFAKGPPVASTSRSPEPQKSQQKPTIGYSSTGQGSIYALPTPPPSSQESTRSSPRKSGGLPEDVFKVPSPPRQRTQSPTKSSGGSRILSHRPMTAHSSPKRVFGAGATMPTPPTSDRKRRLGSVIHEHAFEAIDDGEEDDLAI